VIGPQSYGGIVAIKVSPIEIRPSYLVIFPLDRLSESKFISEMKLFYLSNLIDKQLRNLIKSRNFPTQELIKCHFFTWVIPKPIIKLSNPSSKVERNS